MNLFDVIRQVSEAQKQISSTQDTPGCLNLDAAVKELITEALKKTPHSRYQIAAEMSRDLGKEITKAQIDAWSAESKENHGIRVGYLNAFMKATGDKTILHLICETAGGYFSEGKDFLYKELGKIDKQKRDLSQRERLIKSTLEKLEK